MYRDIRRCNIAYHVPFFFQKWPMRSRLYVSDPMWLYRSGRQTMLNQTADSPTSSSASVSCEESPPSLDTTELHSPSESSMADVERFPSPYRHSCREDNHYNTAIDMEIGYQFRKNDYLVNVEEQRFQTSSCRFQKALPGLRTDHHSL